MREKRKKIIGFLSCHFDHSGSFSQFLVLSFHGLCMLVAPPLDCAWATPGFCLELTLGVGLGARLGGKNPHSVLQRPLFLVLSVFVTCSYCVVLRLVFSQSGKEEREKALKTHFHQGSLLVLTSFLPQSISCCLLFRVLRQLLFCVLSRVFGCNHWEG